MLVGLSGYIGSGKDTVAMLIQALTKDDIGSRWKKDPIGYAKTYKGYPNLKGGWEIRKYAGKLKQVVSLLTGIPVEDLEKQEVKESFLGPEWNTHEWLGDKMYNEAGPKPMTVRTLLQRVGTEAIRNQVHPDAWINALYADYKPIGSADYFTGVEDSGIKEVSFEPIYPKWIISDVRFPNEAQAVKDRDGIVVRINRVFEPTLGEPDGRRTALHSSETSLDNWAFDYTIDNSGTLEELLEQVRTMLLHFKIIQP